MPVALQLDSKTTFTVSFSEPTSSHYRKLKTQYTGHGRLKKNKTGWVEVPGDKT